MPDLLHFTPRARLQKAQNPSSKPLSQFEDGQSTHTNDAPDTRGVLLYENDFRLSGFGLQAVHFYPILDLFPSRPIPFLITCALWSC